MKKLMILFLNIYVVTAQASQDPWLNLQWSLDNTGQAQVVDLDPVRNYRAPGIRSEDVRRPQLDFLSPRQVLVAVLDTGIDRTHPDLKNMIRTKPGECEALAKYLACLSEETETGSCDKKWMDPKNPEADTDKNGYPMDCYGWSAMGAKSEFDIYGSPFFIDTVGHGTHVAGVMGAQIGNGVGIQGVSPHVKLIPVQVVSDKVNEPLKPMSAPGLNLDPEEMAREEQGYKLAQDISDRVARGFLYALREGAEVINMSLGWPQVADSKLLRELMAEANRRGVIVVAAAGNDSTRALLRPCIYEGVICVGSLNPDGALSHFSNFGSGVDIAAPGLSILSTYPEEQRPARFRFEQGYEYLSGTSQASPLVAGAVAELLARGVPASEVYARLILSARPLKPSQAMFEVFASGERNALSAEADPLNKFVFSGQLDIEKALQVPFRAVIQAQRERPEALWDGHSPTLTTEVELINRGAAIATEDVKIKAFIKPIHKGVVRPQVTEIRPLDSSRKTWSQGEKRKFQVKLEISPDQASRIPSDLDLVMEAVYSNGYKQQTVVDLEVVVPLAQLTTMKKTVYNIEGLPSGRWDWIPLESVDGAQRGDVYLLTEQTAMGFRVASYTINGDKTVLKGPVTIPRTQGLNLIAVMWGAVTSNGYIMGAIQDVPPDELEGPAPIHFFDLDFNLQVKSRARYDSKIVQLPFQVRWMRLGSTYRPAWIGAGLEPDKKQDLWDRWENRNRVERVQQRLYWLDEDFKPHALGEVEKKKFVDFVPGPQDEKGVLTALVVKSQGPSSQPSYVQDVSFVSFGDGKVLNVHTSSEELFRSLLEAKRGPLFNLDSTTPYSRGMFWFSEGGLRTQKITTWDQINNQFQHHDARSIRGHFDSALWTQAVYKGARSAGAFVITNTEVQYHNLMTGHAVRKSLERYSFFSNTLQILLAYPLVIQSSEGPSAYRPALFATENIDFERGVKLVVPIFAKDGKSEEVVELVSPGALNVKAGAGCKPFKTPIQLSSGETAMDFYCERKENAPVQTQQKAPPTSVKELIRVFLKY